MPAISDTSGVNKNYTGIYPAGTGQQSSNYRIVSNSHLQFEESDALATFSDATNLTGDGVTGFSVIQTFKPTDATTKPDGSTTFSPEIMGAAFHGIEDSTAPAAYSAAAGDSGPAIYGSVSYAWKYGDTKSANLRGIHAGVNIMPSASGAITNASGVVAFNTNQGTGAITDHRGVWVARGSTAGSVTNSAGVYVQAFSGATNPTNNYGIFVADNVSKGATISRGIYVGGTTWISEFVGRLIMGAPNSAIADADLAVSEASFYLNEAGNTLTVKVKYAAGTVKTGTIALV